MNARVIEPSVSSAPVSTLLIFPSTITITRSQRSASSSRSLELTSTAAPPSAAVTSSRWRSALAPTSTPWVGSSRRKTDGSVVSHFPNRIFCWLPPLKVASGSSTPVAGRTDNRSNHSFVRAFSALRRTIPP